MFSRKKKKKRNTVRENLQIFSPLLLSCDRSFLRLWKGKASMYSFSRRFFTFLTFFTGTKSAAKVYACAESVLWVITTAERLIKSAYSYRIKYDIYRPMYREIYRPMSRPIYRPMSRPIYWPRYRPILGTIGRYIDRYIDRYTRWSISEASVKYRWSIGERQLYRPIGVPVDISGDTQLIYRPIPNRVSTVKRSILDRYLIEFRSRYRPI